MAMIALSNSISPGLRSLLFASALGLFAGVAGCGSSVEQPAEPAASTTAAAAQSEHAAGPGAAFLRAVDSLNLRADQRQVVTSVRASIHEQATPVRAARAALGVELAREVRAGAIDHARVDPLVDQIAAAASKNKEVTQQAVQRIHDTLDASQRQALVASLRAKTPEHAAGAMKAHMEKMSADLGLTDDQRASIRAAMKQAFAGRAEGMRAQHDAMKARMETLATAFQSDTFDAKTLDVGDHHAAMAKHFAGVSNAFLEAAVPVLTPAQRETLAQKIEARTQAQAGEE